MKIGSHVEREAHASPRLSILSASAVKTFIEIAKIF
jgi:hypothetical protein